MQKVSLKGDKERVIVESVLLEGVYKYFDSQIIGNLCADDF